MRRALAGDGEGFGLLVERYWTLMVGLAVCRVKDAAAAEDIAQEAFIKAHAALARLRNEARFQPWLARIVHNLAMDHLRRRGQERLVMMEDLSTLPDDRQAAAAGPHGLSDDQRRLVWEAVGRLPEKLQSVVLLRFASRLPLRQIAERLGEHPTTVRVRLHRALRRLRREIDPLLMEPDEG